MYSVPRERRAISDQGISEAGSTRTERAGQAEAPVTNGSGPATKRVGRDIRSGNVPTLARLLHKRTLRAIARVAILLASDYLAIASALIGWLALKAWLKGDFDAALVREQVNSYLTFAYLVSVLMLARHDLYNERARRPGLPSIVNALFQATVVTLIFALANGEKFNSYSVFIGALGFAIVTVTTARALVDRGTGRLSAEAGLARKALVVGTGDHAASVAIALGESNRWPLEVIGGLTAPEDVVAKLRRGSIDAVIIAEPELPQEQVVLMADECHRKGVEVHVAPTTMEILLQRGQFRPGMAVPLFTLDAPTFDGFNFAIKRAFDLIGAIVLLVLLSPTLLIVALAVKLTSKGPLLYRSIRPGIGEQPFACLKFRTMFDDADSRMDDLESLNEASGALFKIRKDPRVTPIGRMLRRFSIDELPQLLNVLRGEMSLVGPRPLPERDFRLLEDWHRQRYQVLPGITGLWQVSGRSDLDFDDLVRLDFVYVERWSVGLDLLILLKTFPAVLSRRGAY
ncbi:MAG: sugar transferase [Actinomycetes bacterium]